jgi:hypothetical protein
VAVSRCLPPVHWPDSVSSASTRGPTVSHTGRGRGAASVRTGTACSTYFRTVFREIPNSFATRRCERPSTNTWCRTTCTWSTLSILLADPKHTASATANQALKWLTFRAANGSLSKRRAHSVCSGTVSRL